MVETERPSPLELAEDGWQAVKEAYYAFRDGADEDEVIGEMMELGSLYALLRRVRPATPEERERLEQLLEDIRRVAREFGFEPPSF